jgi:hypothetical protein
MKRACATKNASQAGRLHRDFGAAQEVANEVVNEFESVSCSQGISTSTWKPVTE